MAFLTTGAFVGVYAKLPTKIRKFCEKHQLATEVCAMVATYALHGSTIVALLASGVVGLFVTAALHVMNNPEKYEYLFAAKDAVVEQLSIFSEKLNVWGKAFLAERIALRHQQKTELTLVA